MSTRHPSARWFAFLSVAILVAASSARAATTSLVPALPLVCPLSVTPGQQFTVEVKIDVGATVLGAYTLTIGYPPTAVNVSAITGGDTSQFSANPTTNSASFTTGSTRFNAFQTDQTGPTGVVSVAHIAFNTVASGGASGTLSLTVNSMFAGDGSAITATGTSCSLTVVGPTTTTTSTPGTTSTSTTTTVTTTSATTTTSTTTTVTTSSSTTTSSTTTTLPPTTTTSSTTTSSTTTTLPPTTTTSSSTTSSTTSTAPPTTTTSSTTTSSTTSTLPPTTTSSTTTSSTTSTLGPTTTTSSTTTSSTTSTLGPTTTTSSTTTSSTTSTLGPTTTTSSTTTLTTTSSTTSTVTTSSSTTSTSTSSTTVTTSSTVATTSSTTTTTVPSTTTSTLQLPANTPPVCTAATAALERTWPPNHRFVTVTIAGVTDPDGDPVSITVTGITQDEDVDGAADGSTCPDGAGIGRDVGRVRLERSSRGNGRTYHVTFRADDDRGGSCTGTVDLCIPLHKGDACGTAGTFFDADGPPCVGTCPDICDLERALAEAFCSSSLPVKIDRRLIAGRHALERAARGVAVTTQKHLVTKALQLLDSARMRVAEAQTDGTISADCAADVRAALDETRTRANAWLAAQ